MRTFKVFLLTGIVLFTLHTMGQVAVNTDGTAPDGSAMLDVQSTSKGILIPRMSTANRISISSPATGLLVYDTDTKSFWFRTSSGWKEIYGSNNNTTLADADNDTKVEVEQTSDQDAISFTMNGTEFFRFDSARIEVLNSGRSVFLGSGAGGNDDYSDNGNTGIGYNALRYNETGSFNVAIGFNAMENPKEKSGNTAIGYSSMRYFDNAAQNIATYNTAVGMQSLQGYWDASYNTGKYNTAIGTNAMKSNQSGEMNTSMGYNSLNDNTTGSKNTAMGTYALLSNKGNSRTVAIGYQAMYYADDRTTGRDTYNTAIGYASLSGTSPASANTGRYNTAVGDNTLTNNSSGDYNIAFGGSALESNTQGDYNTALGYNALFSNVSNNRSTAIGYQAMYFADSRTTGRNTYNTAIGHKALYGSTTATSNTGRYNVAVGDASMENNSGGSNNVAVGASALNDNTAGHYNVGIGYFALSGNDGGDYNIAVGGNAMYNNDGDNNTAVGYNALYANTSGNHNTAFGYMALDAATGSSQNTAIGYNSLTALTTGSMNLALGDGSGDNLTSGSNNIFIGSNTDAPVTTGSRQLNIGNTIYGTNIGLSTAEIGIGTDSPEEELDVRGNFQVKQTSGAVSVNIESSSAGASLLLKANGSTLGQVKFYDNGAYGASIGYDNDENHIFFYHGTNIFIDNGNFIPGTHKGGDLGIDGQAWDDIYYDDLHNQGAAAFTDRVVTDEIVNFPPIAKTPGSFDYKTNRGNIELNPQSLPKDLHDKNSILTDEVVTYNYKANYEQQLQINQLKKIIEEQNKKIEQLMRLLSGKEKN